MMSEETQKITLSSIFEKGIANSEFFTKSKEGSTILKCLLKVVRLLLFKLFVAKKKQVIPSSIKLVWIPLHEKVLRDYDGEEIVLLDRRYPMRGQSFLSYVPLSIITHAIATTPVSIIKRGLLYEWCFFSVLSSFLKAKDIKKITIAGHYDKYATWVSYLSKEVGTYLVISQHGASSKFVIPYKIPANKIDVFSKAEEEMFRTTMLDPSNTVFFIKGFKSSLVFTKGNFSDRTIAIASQPKYEERVIELIKCLLTIDSSLNIIVYSHPSDGFRKGLLALPHDVSGCRLEHEQRFWDVNYLIVFTSTLAYDYWSCESFKGKVLCYYDETCFVAIYNDERAILLYPQTIDKQLRKILIGVEGYE